MEIAESANINIITNHTLPLYILHYSWWHMAHLSASNVTTPKICNTWNVTDIWTLINFFPHQSGSALSDVAVWPDWIRHSLNLPQILQYFKINLNWDTKLFSSSFKKINPFNFHSRFVTVLVFSIKQHNPFLSFSTFSPLKNHYACRKDMKGSRFVNLIMATSRCDVIIET